MDSQKRQQKGQVVVARIGQMGFALLQDCVGIPTNQGTDCFELLLGRLAFLPAANELAQQGDQGIDLFLVLAPIGIKRLLGLVMHLLHKAQEHFSEVVQRLRRADTGERDGQGGPFGFPEAIHLRNIQRPRLVGKALQLSFWDAIDRMSSGIEGLKPPGMTVRRVVVNPVRRALRDDAALPASVRGPVECWAFRRFASVLTCDDFMCVSLSLSLPSG